METRTYKLIIFHDNKAVLVEDNEIPYAGETQALCLSEIQYGFKEAYVLDVQNCHSCRRIVATNFLPNLRLINFNGLKFDGLTDIAQLATEYAISMPMAMDEDEVDIASNGYYNGYEKAMNDNATKQFTADDLYHVMNLGMALRQDQLRGYSEQSGNSVLEQYIQDLQKPKVYDVELNVQTDSVLAIHGKAEWIPVVQGNFIRIISTNKLNLY